MKGSQKEREGENHILIDRFSILYGARRRLSHEGKVGFAWSPQSVEKLLLVVCVLLCEV